jgi:hypothetical protein
VSQTLLDAAGRSPAFDPMPPPGSLAAAHVPYSHLTGEDVEAALSRQLEGYGRVALIGPTGAGKSSLARYVLRPNGHRLAAIWINVATERHDAIGTVRGFLEILGGQLLHKAQRADALDGDHRRELFRRLQQSQPLGRDEEALKAVLGGSAWLLRGELAGEVKSAVEYGSGYRPTEDLRDAVREVLTILRGHELLPVLVADDTDRLLKVGGDPDLSERLFTGFFGEVVREIADQLECALIVAAHDRYARRADYREMTEGLLRALRLPAFDRPEQFGRVITARIEFVDERASWRDLVEEGVLERLRELHLGEHNRSVRRTLATLREAFSLAAAQGAELCQVEHVDGAAAGAVGSD